MDQPDFGEFEFLRKLTETPGISGREERVRELIRAETQGLWDETRVDPMGNLICLRRASRSAEKPARRRPAKAARPGKGGDGEAAGPRPPRVMLACHMDEIGFYVRHVDENGLLRVQNVGGFDTRNLFARKVLVQGQRDLLGVLNPGGKPVHVASEEERKKIPEIHEFFVDLFMPRRQVERLVNVGDPVTLVQKTELVGEAISGKSMDNRVAAWVAINAIRQACGAAQPAEPAASGGEKPRRPRRAVAPPGSRYDIYFVACVQEEVGLRGAATAAFGIEPDVGIAIDVTLACDTPGTPKEDVITTFGGGVGIKVMDSSVISHRGLFEEFVNIATRRRIPFQREVLPRGGTDAGAVQRARAGTRAITLSVPVRYVHTVTEAIHRKDARAAVELVAAWLSV